MNMKKLVILALAALLTAPVFAQSIKDPVYASSDGKAMFDLFDHLGYGYNFVKTDAFTPGWSGDFFLNVLKFGLYPVEKLGLEVGVDLSFNDFASKDAAFVLHDGIVNTADFSTIGLGSTFDRKRSDFAVFGLSAPVLVKGIFEKVEIGVGAVANWNITGSANAYLRKDNRELNYTESKGKVNPFSYGIMAVLSYNQFGVYFKYYPKSPRVLPEASPIDMSFMTLGVSLGL